MKKLISLLLFLFAIFLVKSQDLPSKNSILGIERHLMKEDFFLNEVNGIFPMKIVEINKNIGFMANTTIDSLVFNNKKQLVNKKHFLYFNSYKKNEELKFSYNNSKLSRIDFFENNKQRFYFPYYSFVYDTTEKLIKIESRRVTYSKPYNIATFKYINNGNEIIKTDENAKKTKYKLSNDHSTVLSEEKLNNNLLPKSAKLYMNLGKGIKVIHYPDLINLAQKNEVLANYYVDKKGSVIKYNEKKGTLTIKDEWVLLYDKYNNWIAKRNKVFESLFIREITYSNGDVTGFKSFDSIKYSKFLESTKNKNTSKIPQKGAYWIKNDDGSMLWIYIDGKGIKTKWLFETDDFVCVYNPSEQQFFKISGFANKPANEFHKAEVQQIKSNLGYWFKFIQEDGKENYSLFQTNGKVYDYSDFEKFSLDTKGNYIGFKKDGSKIVLENAKDIKSYIVQPLVPFDASIHDKNTSTKSKYTWIKNNDGSQCYIYINGKKVLIEHSNFFIGNTLYAIDYNREELYIMEQYYAKSPNMHHAVDKIQSIENLDGLWYKNEKNQFYAFDKKGKGISDISRNYWEGKNLRFNRKSSDKTYEMKNYNFGKINTIYPLKIVENKKTQNVNTISNNSTGNSFSTPPDIQKTVNQWYSSCSNDSKCITNKLDAWFYKKEKQGNTTAQLQQEIADITIALFNKNKDMPLRVLMKVNSKYYEYYLALNGTGKIPKEIVEYIRNGGKNIISSYKNK